MGLLSRLFGTADPQRVEVAGSSGPERSSLDTATYFALVDSIRTWQSKREYHQMLECCAQSLPLLPSLVRDCRRQYGAFDISSIPAIEVGCRYWAALGDCDNLRQVAEAVDQVAILKEEWGDVVQTAYSDMDLAVRIQACIVQNPGVLQNKLNKVVVAPGKDTARIINTLVNLGKVVRTRSGKTYELRVAGIDVTP